MLLLLDESYRAGGRAISWLSIAAAAAAAAAEGETSGGRAIR